MKQFTDFILGGIHGSYFTSLRWEDAHNEIVKILPNAIQNSFKMYGEAQINTFTFGHAFDGSAPDQIIGRKELYIHYLDQLTQLLDKRYSLNITSQKREEVKSKFQLILDYFSSTNDMEKRIDGVLAYENAKLLNPNDLNLTIFIPSSWNEARVIEEASLIATNLSNRVGTNVRLYRGTASDGITKIEVRFTGPENNLSFDTVFPY